MRTGDKMKIKCTHCKHKWEYKGKAQQATCPSCLRKVKVKGGKDGK